MLVCNVNNSISDKNNHYNGEQIAKILQTNYDKIAKDDLYVVNVIFTESDIRDLYDFSLKHKIGYSVVKELYVNWKKDYKRENKYYEWLFFGKV